MKKAHLSNQSSYLLLLNNASMHGVLCVQRSDATHLYIEKLREGDTNASLSAFHRQFSDTRLLGHNTNAFPPAS